MAKHLDDAEVETIVDLIENSSDQLTWEGISLTCEKILGRKISRQTLARKSRIVEAIKARKRKENEYLESVQKPIPSSMRVAIEKIERLELKINRLERENTQLLEQFVRWQYNSFKHGMRPDQLNENLPEIDLSPTEN